MDILQTNLVNDSSPIVFEISGYGYCNRCQLPTIVARVRIKGWLHPVYICAPCLREVACAIVEGEKQ